MPSGNLKNNQIKINIGCELSGISGWHKLDHSPPGTLSRIPLLDCLLKAPAWPRDVRRHDVRKGLPFPDSSVRYIRSSHTLEHFTPAESAAVAKECFQVPTPQGILRIVVPDLELMVREYLADSSPLAARTFLSWLSLYHSFHDLIHPGSNHSQRFEGKSLLQ